MHLIISGILQLIIVVLLIKSIDKLRERIEKLKIEIVEHKNTIELLRQNIYKVEEVKNEDIM